MIAPLIINVIILKGGKAHQNEMRKIRRKGKHTYDKQILVNSHNLMALNGGCVWECNLSDGNEKISRSFCSSWQICLFYVVKIKKFK